MTTKCYRMGADIFRKVHQQVLLFACHFVLTGGSDLGNFKGQNMGDEPDSPSMGPV